MAVETSGAHDPVGVRPFLVVARVGDDSLHPTWVRGQRNFDLVVDYYGATPGRWAGTADLVLESKGSKWRGLHALLDAHPRLLSEYEAVWFPDDDIAADAATISAMFELHRELGLGLSQPALSADSYYTHLMTLQHPGLTVRFTNFVEVMVPVFSREALAACWPTFAESASGFGLDLVWQSIVPGLGLRSAVLDALTVRHTRPLGTGSLYDGMSEPPHVEGARVARAHGLPTPYEFRTHAVLDAQFRLLADVDVVLAQHLPQPTQQAVPAWDLYARDLERRLGAPAPRAAFPDLPSLPVPAPLPATPHVRAAQLPPVAVVVAPRASPHAATWRAAGWEVADVDPRDTSSLEELLGLAENAPARVLDLQGLSGDELEAWAHRGHRAGFDTVVRLEVALDCDHAFPAGVRDDRSPCPSCAVRWRSTTSAVTVVVADPTRVLPGSAAPVLARFPVPAPPPPAPDVDPVDVLVLVGATVEQTVLDRCLGGLVDQLGLVRAPQVALADLRTAAEPQGAIGEALRTLRGERVLVLDAADVPGPWLLHDHTRAAAARPRATVLSPARHDTATGEDLLADALHAGPSPAVDHPPVTARVSLPRTLLTDLTTAQGLGTASAVAAVACRAQDVVRLAVAGHRTARPADLGAVAAATVSDALAAALAGPAPEDEGVSSELVHWTHTATTAVSSLAELATATPRVLRSTPQHYFTGRRFADQLRDDVVCALTAHAVAAHEAAARTTAAIAEVRPVLLAVDAADDRLPGLLAAAARADLVASGWLKVLLVLDPGQDPGRCAAELAARLEAVGGSLEVLAHVDVRTAPWPAASHVEADLTLPDADVPWCPRLPVPLVGAQPLEWLARLELVALAAAVRQMAEREADRGRRVQTLAPR